MKGDGDEETSEYRVQTKVDVAQYMESCPDYGVDQVENISALPCST